MPRPEYHAPSGVFYNEADAHKYTTSSRIIEILVSKQSTYMFDFSFAHFCNANLTNCTFLQSRISERALELLALPKDGVPKLLLDIGWFNFPSALLGISRRI
jgi:18S rRNA (guanine1575-N7)-methyltransferase